jgi:hypothetical protein
MAALILGQHNLALRNRAIDRAPVTNEFKNCIEL